MAVSARVSYFTLSNATSLVQVENGNAITVHQILISNVASGNNREVTVRTADGSAVTLMDFELDVGGEFIVDTPFLADKGIEFVNITDNANSIHVTVWHSNTGM